MAATKGDGWLIDHPFGDIDRIGKAAEDPRQVPNIHLDIFFPGSLDTLRQVVDYDNPDAILDMSEGSDWRRSVLSAQEQL